MRIAIVLCTGFAQPQRISNGMAALREELLELKPALLTLTNWRASLRQLDKELESAKPDRVVLAGHSKGGNTMNNLAVYRELSGIRPVHGLVLCDAFGANLGRGDIRVPPNVRKLWVFRGTKSVIKGSRVVAFDRGQTQLVQEVVRDDVPHQKMDELPEFRAAVLAACQA